MSMHMTFEGEHRCGKGTQIEIALAKLKGDAVVVRGDGSYQGGLEGFGLEGELAFRAHLNEVLYTESKGKSRLWGMAATACAATIGFPELKGHRMLIDRGPLSRASYLLSIGVEQSDVPALMYPSYELRMLDRTVKHEAMRVEDVDFGNIVYLDVPTEVLLARVSDIDPKAEFRRRNITSKVGLFERAIDTMPPSIQDAVITVDGNMAPEAVFAQYSHLLD